MISWTKVQVCILYMLVVDGQWSPWVMTSPCSTTCGPGIEEYERSCSAPEQKNIGFDCDRSGLQEYKEEPCNFRKCIGIFVKTICLKVRKLDTQPFLYFQDLVRQSFSHICDMHWDDISSVLHFPSLWGHWGSMEICPGDHDYVVGMAIKSEGDQGGMR